MSFLCLMIKLSFWNTGKKSPHFYDKQSSKKKQPERFQADLRRLHEYLDQGKISPAIHKVYLLQEVSNAHQEFEQKDSDGYVVMVN